ncbi:MAG TPA: hypothetical protein VFK73_05865, partial [Paludibacter sp.]|nr:hypothetical protein [Paludibacter sp.]
SERTAPQSYALRQYRTAVFINRTALVNNIQKTWLVAVSSGCKLKFLNSFYAPWRPLRYHHTYNEVFSNQAIFALRHVLRTSSLRSRN